MPFRYNGLVRPLECAPAPCRRLLVAHEVVQGWIDGTLTALQPSEIRSLAVFSRQGQNTSTFHYGLPASPARPPGADPGARALSTPLYPSYSSFATRIARRGAPSSAPSPQNNTYHMSSRCESHTCKANTETCCAWPRARSLGCTPRRMARPRFGAVRRAGAALVLVAALLAAEAAHAAAPRHGSRHPPLQQQQVGQTRCRTRPATNTRCTPLRTGAAYRDGSGAKHAEELARGGRSCVIANATTCALPVWWALARPPRLRLVGPRPVSRPQPQHLADDQQPLQAAKRPTDLAPLGSYRY